MICIELTFTDDPQRLAARLAHRHRLARLRERGALAAAGPWSDDSGALLIFRMDEAEMQAELAGDPYYRTPGVQIASVRRWAPVVGL
ncbi:MAG: YciI family protein [Streptosporangiaceae bacterium]